MIPAHITAKLNEWIKNDEWVEEKPALLEELLRQTLQAVRAEPALGVILPAYVLERIEYVETH